MPELMVQSVWIMLVITVPSLMVMDRPVEDTWPEVWEKDRVPRALPMVHTCSPTTRSSESPSTTGFRPDTPSIFSTATSLSSSPPTSLAS